MLIHALLLILHANGWWPGSTSWCQSTATFSNHDISVNALRNVALLGFVTLLCESCDDLLGQFGLPRKVILQAGRLVDVR
jgi:hypothetical protein